MKVSCDIIKDILPLYAENMVSEDTKGMVEEHLCGCPDCTERLDNMRQAQKVPAAAAETDASSMKRVGDAIKKRRWTAVAFAALLALTVSFGLYMFMNKREYLPLEDAVVAVEETGDRVEVKFSNQVSNFTALYELWPDAEKEKVFLVAYNTRWDRIINANRGREDYTFSCSTDWADRIYYANSNTGNFDTVIWGETNNDLVTSLPRLAMHYYFLIALVCGVALLIPAVILRRKKAGAVLEGGSAFFWCYALCSFLVAEGDWRVYDDVNFTVHFLSNVLLSVLLWLTLLAGSKLWKISKRDEIA